MSAVVGIGGLGGARFPFCLLGCEKTKKQSSTSATQVTCDVAPTRSQGIRQSTVYADDDTFRRENQYIDTAAVTGSSVRTHSHAQLTRTCTRAHAQDMAVVTGSVSAQISRQPERNSHSPSYLAWNQSGKHHGEEAPSRLAALAVCLAVCLSVSVCLSVCLPVFFMSLSLCLKSQSLACTPFALKLVINHLTHMAYAGLHVSSITLPAAAVHYCTHRNSRHQPIKLLLLWDGNALRYRSFLSPNASCDAPP